MTDDLSLIIKNFDKTGEIFAKGNRNTIKKFTCNNQIINVKSFKIPILINGFIYSFFRKSKARRSFENANFLIEKGIGTPKPIAFFENKFFGFLRQSYYVSEQMNPDFLFRSVFEDNPKLDLDKILRGIARFTFKLHENGIEFLDHSPGNTLVKVDSEGNYEFYLVDLNRMNFHQTMSFETRIRNLSRLTPGKLMVEVICNEYAKLYNQSEQKIFDALWKEIINLHIKLDRKKLIKKKLMFWKQ